MPVSASIPVLFLGLSVIWLMFTINAFRPALRIGPLLGPSFFAAWLTGELALHHLLGQMAIAALLIWLGGWQQSPSLIALAVACLSWAGLLGIFVQSRRADRVVEEALRKELGTAYLERIPEELKTGLAERWSLRQRWLPLAIYDHRVECIKNIVFSRAGGIDLKLDVYRPKDLPRGTGCPTVLFVHGGAWMIGNKDHQGKPLANRLAAHGWVVVSTSYRLSPRFTFPDHIIDVKNAIRWIREHGKEYGANPDFIVITGGSAGGHLAALAALTPNDPKWQPGFENVDTRVQACVPFYGAFDFTDRNGYWKHSLLVPMIERYILKKRLRDAHAEFDAASPMSHVNEKAPPFFVIHGEMDSLAPVEEARHFVELLRAKSKAPVVYAEIPGAQHAFEVFPSERTGHVLAGVERFVGAVYGEWSTGNRSMKELNESSSTTHELVTPTEESAHPQHALS